MKRDEIINIIEEHCATLRGFGVKSIGLFGSYARGEERATSDLDFIVELEHKTFDDYMTLKNILKNFFPARWI